MSRKNRQKLEPFKATPKVKPKVKPKKEPESEHIITTFGLSWDFKDEGAANDTVKALNERRHNALRVDMTQTEDHRWIVSAEFKTDEAAKRAIMFISTR